jgi:hypothetical protein
MLLLLLLVLLLLCMLRFPPTGQCTCDTPTNGYAHRLRLDKATVDAGRFVW